MELMITTGKIVPKLQVEHGLVVDRVYTGSFMTSFVNHYAVLIRIISFVVRFFNFYYEGCSSYSSTITCSN